MLKISKDPIVNVLFWVLILIAFLSIVCSISGCALVDQIGDVLSPDTEQIVPTVPKEQLWQTIKGLTPNWLAIPVIALGAVAMFNGAVKLGMSCIIFGSVNLFMALATSRFGFWMAVCGLVGSMAAVAASIVTKNKAVRELICGGQIFKEGTEHFDLDLSNVFNDCHKNAQSKTTKKIVQQIKSKLKLKEIL